MDEARRGGTRVNANTLIGRPAMEGRWPGRHVAGFPRPLAFRLSLFALIRLGRTSRAPLVACYFSLPSTHLPQSSGCACVRLPTFLYDPAHERHGQRQRLTS